jgi:hypothetical protein
MQHNCRARAAGEGATIQGKDTAAASTTNQVSCFHICQSQVLAADGNHRCGLGYLESYPRSRDLGDVQHVKHIGDQGRGRCKSGHHPRRVLGFPSAVPWGLLREVGVYLDIFRERVGDLDTGLTSDVMYTSHPPSDALERAEPLIGSGSKLRPRSHCFSQ